MRNFRDRFWTDNYPEGVPADIDPDKYPNLIALIDEAFDNHPQATAYTCLGRSVTFFQAEDGIRDRSPSRGLGDVYKRQLLCSLTLSGPLIERTEMKRKIYLSEAWILL